MLYALCLPPLVIALLTALPAAADPVEISHRVRALLDQKLEVQFAELDRKLEVQFAELLDRNQQRIAVALKLEDPRQDSNGAGVDATTVAGLSPDGGAPLSTQVADRFTYLGDLGRAAEESASNKGSADLATRMTCAVLVSPSWL